MVQTEKDCKRLFPREKWNDLHLQIIFYGREFCPARGHIWVFMPYLFSRWKKIVNSKLNIVKGSLLIRYCRILQETVALIYFQQNTENYHVR